MCGEVRPSLCCAWLEDSHRVPFVPTVMYIVTGSNRVPFVQQGSGMNYEATRDMNLCGVEDLCLQVVSGLRGAH